MLQILVAITQKFAVENRYWVMQKLFLKKEEIRKNRQVSEISKTIGTLDARLKKDE